MVQVEGAGQEFMGPIVSSKSISMALGHDVI